MRCDTYTKVAALMLATACFGRALNAAGPQPVETQRFFPSALASFELVLGRLQLSSESFLIGAAHERSKLADGRERTRSVSISTYRGKPTLQFRDSGGDEDVQLSFKADRKVEIVQSVRRDVESYKLSYLQPAEGPVSLRVEFGDGRNAIDLKARSLWHLAMEEPNAFSDYMQPCLSRLEPGLQIARTISDVKDIMNNPLHHSDTQEIERLIEQLDAELSSERYNAACQLESLGVVAEYRLRQSLSSSNSIQQASSIKRLLSTLQPTGNDTPMRVAVWLSGERK